VSRSSQNQANPAPRYGGLVPPLVKKKEEEMVKLQNPTDNTGYMPLKRHIALAVIGKAIKRHKKTLVMLKQPITCCNIF